MNLSTALRNIHADPFWWRKLLLGGALNLSIIGLPWSAGLVSESLENVRKGFPSPLPPNFDPSTRYIIGLFSLIIDFFFFILPLILLGLVVLCGVVALTIGQTSTGSALATGITLGVVLAYEAAMFAIGAAPIGRLAFAGQAGIERALSMETLQVALAPRGRQIYWQARLHSLPGYLPLLVLAAATWASTLLVFPGRMLLTVALVWLTSSALVYAHLVVAQLYGDAERLIE